MGPLPCEMAPDRSAQHLGHPDIAFDQRGGGRYRARRTLTPFAAQTSDVTVAWVASISPRAGSTSAM